MNQQMKQEMQSLLREANEGDESLPFNEIGFAVQSTRDGSPTLLLTAQGESMHHSGGAATETWYIYGEPLRAAFKAVEREPSLDHLRLACVGLGLGYIEIVYGFILFIEAGQKIRSQWDSFEKVSPLINKFSQWLQHHKDSKQTPSVDFVYDNVFDHLLRVAPLPFQNSIKPSDKAQVIKTLISHIQLRGDIFDIKDNEKWNVICFDAFSKKTNETLWTSDFLDQFIKQHCEDDCVFTTYACTGDLKKGLEKNGFTLLKRPGFSGKRESTLALRGRFKLHLEIFQTF